MSDTAPTRASAALTGVSARSSQVFHRLQGTMTPEDWRAFLALRGSSDTWGLVLIAAAALFFPIVTAGALGGFARAYHRVLQPRGIAPRLWPLDVPSVWGLVLGGVLGLFINWLPGIIATLRGNSGEAPPTLPEWLFYGVFSPPGYGPGGMAAFGVLVLSLLTFAVFYRWFRRAQVELAEAGRFGSARFARRGDLDQFHQPAHTSARGFYVGHMRDTDQWLYYPRQGHFLTVGGTRSGKGVSSIIPNLLLDSLRCSWVVVDPKGENAAVTAARMRELGKSVLVLNPWDLLADTFARQGLAAATYNPLALLATSSDLNLVDDVDILAEMIVPIPPGGIDKDHFTSRAREFVSGLILHLVTSPATTKNPHALATIYRWLRLPDEGFEELLAALAQNPHPVAGPAIRATGSAMGALKVGSSREFASIISTAQRFTEFLKSPPLAASMHSSSFDPAKLSDGNTVVFVIIPADRLKTPAASWLRLVVTSLMRSVVRRPGRRVTFLLDEAYALGYVSEIETALGTYAGFNVSVWSIYQNLTQLGDLYGRNWENFLASAAVRQFFGIGDQFTADYLSKFLGTKTLLELTPLATFKGVSARPLVNPDEVRRGSRDTMYTFIEQEFPAEVEKISYRDLAQLAAIAAPNPYAVDPTASEPAGRAS